MLIRKPLYFSPLGSFSGGLPHILCSPLHHLEVRHHFFLEAGSASHRPWGWSVFRWSLCFLPQNKSQNSGPAYSCPLSLEGEVNHQPLQDERLAFIVGPGGHESRAYKRTGGTGLWGRGRWPQASMAGRQWPHLLHFLGVHLHRMALRTSW